MNHTRHLQRLSQGIKIPIPHDERGFVGRECPNKECEGYFKIKPGTGVPYQAPCYCPYCGHKADHDQFWTQEQIAYARSVMLNELNKALQMDVREWDRSLRRKSRNSFIKLSVQFKSSYHPIRHYRERQLETEVTCDNCTLSYSVFGVFAFCPDCGMHNSVQILEKNLELAEKEVALASGLDDHELVQYLIIDALENAVSAFDGFGRETCKVFAVISADPSKAEKLSFQNLQNVNSRIQTLFGFDLVAAITTDEWAFAHQCFQKRHLFTHKMGVVDEAYKQTTDDPQAILGRKVTVNSDEVLALTVTLRKLGSHLVAQLTSISNALHTKHQS